ncbi:hypothetical protein AQJ46_49855 [Streptomyces canus]|uniref:Alanine-rich protein n=1 Tax=Streptomyces canus TaxID=58343 RepID=A0A101RK01_9ACTN|nr:MULTISPECIES: hypothetical protein [Streptomyces]KUN54734.1 hypothetical protein AQJ46_49855 [Streptomyces canus]MDI5911669.1 hypothetical protein [Streptomyces sp. 12257]
MHLSPKTFPARSAPSVVPSTSSVYAFVEDLRAEGVDAVLDRVLGTYGCDTLTVAAAYHRARDVTPHGPARVTLRQDGTHVPPPADLFGGVRLTPPVQPGAEREPLRELRLRTAQRGAALHGWTVFLHNTTLGLAHPDVTQENCFGDRAAPADLCPANPDVRAYAVALARSVARQGVDAVVSESLHFGSFGHGYHHERSFVPLGPVEEFLLGLCFCPSCVERADGTGVDCAAARAEATRIVGRLLDGADPLPGALVPGELADVAGESVAAYVRARCDTVTSLAAAVANAVASEGSRLVFLDLTGAVKGYAVGLPTGPLAAEEAWRIGVDPAAVGAVVDDYAVLAYARDPARVAADTAAYRAALPDSCSLRTVLRPGAPDTASADALAEKTAAATGPGRADAVDFYHYGLLPFPVLDRIPTALKARG